MAYTTNAMAVTWDIRAAGASQLSGDMPHMLPMKRAHRDSYLLNFILVSD